MMFIQYATWWKLSSKDGFGKPSFAKPIIIKCRWEDKNDLFMDHKGEKHVSRSVVYIEKDQNINISDYVKLGKSTEINPVVVKALKVREKSVTPNLRNTESCIKLWL